MIMWFLWEACISLLLFNSVWVAACRRDVQTFDVDIGVAGIEPAAVLMFPVYHLFFVSSLPSFWLSEHFSQFSFISFIVLWVTGFCFCFLILVTAVEFFVRVCNWSPLPPGAACHFTCGTRNSQWHSYISSFLDVSCSHTFSAYTWCEHYSELF